MVFLGKNLNMSIVASIGYCIEVVGKEGQGVLESSGLKVATVLWLLSTILRQGSSRPKPVCFLILLMERIIKEAGHL